MRRVHAVSVIVALLATPLALLARADCGQATCICMCAMVQRSYSSSLNQHRNKMFCGQLPGQKQSCAMNSRHQPPDYGLNTLMAPTAPADLVVLLAPIAARQIVLQQAQSTIAGFLPAPFQPPRS